MANELATINKFLDNNRASYLLLLRYIREEADALAKKYGANVILRVYDRSAKGGDGLKEKHKVLAACKRPVSFGNLKNIGDIIGLTIVVQYNDQIDSILDELDAALQDLSIERIARKPMRGTYFATHALYKSKSAQHHNLLCEVQCKTMLHDSWSAKMHDLTYKPQGNLSGLMRELVESVSVTLESIENQSQIMRDIIFNRQELETRPFETSREVLLENVTGEMKKHWAEKESIDLYDSIASEILSLKTKIAVGASDPAKINELMDKISDLCAKTENVRIGWMLAAHLAGVGTDEKLLTFLAEQIEDILPEIPEWHSSGRFSEMEIAAIPLTFYVLQDFDRAFEYTDRILDHASGILISERRKILMEFNRTTWLLERESLRPSKAAARKDLRKDILAQLEKFEGYQDDELASSLLDTRGLYKIIFGETRQEIREGIHECTLSATDAVEDETEVAQAYAEWRMHFGWLRYFDVAHERRKISEETDDAGKAGGETGGESN